MIFEVSTLDVRALAGNASYVFFCEFSGSPYGLSENTDEVVHVHPYQMDASQSKGFEISFTVCMLRPAILKLSSQTATNTISAALLRHSDESPQSVFFFTLFSLSVKSTVLGQHVILLISP